MRLINSIIKLKKEADVSFSQFVITLFSVLLSCGQSVIANSSTLGKMATIVDSITPQKFSSKILNTLKYRTKYYSHINNSITFRMAIIICLSMETKKTLLIM